ncbi:hypothetical protein TIFTF001_034979 [Ficus carica]|uniref:Glabrous enhancer-binding protein-like DBD domain-containing protein n=1 Tax=Ficus carica TaxID=3494 RepID=A0AA88E0W7_FICCA|nr:hypothetical protein TIFTF001_034979 [Ficus carica]
MSLNFEERNKKYSVSYSVSSPLESFAFMASSIRSHQHSKLFESPIDERGKKAKSKISVSVAATPEKKSSTKRPRESDDFAKNMKKKSDYEIVVEKKTLMDKVLKLRKRYENDAEKKNYKPINPYGQKVFTLSQKIWGSNGNGNRAEEETATKTFCSPTPAKASSSGSLRNMMIGMPSLPDQVLKKWLDLIPEPKKMELNSRWKKIHVDELQLFLRMNKLMNIST